MISYEDSKEIFGLDENSKVEDMIDKGTQYKSFNFDKVMITQMRRMIQIQKKQNKPNKKLNIQIIKTAMAALL